MIVVFRFGYWFERDKRIMIYVVLMVRVFGVDKIIIVVEEDEYVKESVEDVVNCWGGFFEIEFNFSWKKILREWKDRGIIVYFIMYGIYIDDVIFCIKDELKFGKDFFIVVGVEKVLREVYEMVDYNVVVGN